jgi:hypothetical protein
MELSAQGEANLERFNTILEAQVGSIVPENQIRFEDAEE